MKLGTSLFLGMILIAFYPAVTLLNKHPALFVIFTGSQIGLLVLVVSSQISFQYLGVIHFSIAMLLFGYSLINTYKVV